MVRIVTEQAYRRAKASVENDQVSPKRRGFCYLCGNQLFKPGSAPPTADHVIPRSVAGPSMTDGFGLVLRVHAKCEKQKSQLDETATVIERSFSDPESVSSRESGNLRARFPLADRGRDSSGRFMLTYKPDFERAVNNWMRGCYSLLYRQPISHRSIGVVAPFSSAAGDLQDAQTSAMKIDQVRDRILRVVEYGVRESTFDEITNWGGRFAFIATSERLKSSSHRPTYALYWVLSTPRTRDWTTMLGGGPLPWCGITKVPYHVDSASVIDNPERAARPHVGPSALADRLGWNESNS